MASSMMVLFNLSLKSYIALTHKKPWQLKSIFEHSEKKPNFQLCVNFSAIFREDKSREILVTEE